MTSRWYAVALATPGCALAALSMVALTLAALDRHPMWPNVPLNLAEAAGTRDEAEVTRLIENGADPNTRYPVRPGLIFDLEIRLTPLEAAVASRDPEMLDRLLALGTTMDSDLWRHLRCIADNRRMGLALDAARPAGARDGCDGISPPWPR